ncbi:Hint domain-containing protein [Streptomyces bobili]|uniref:Hint domain-containing protein n=1 Tax=Streptomyces bobili TaxID=67280 RepID=UPI0037124B18
MAAEALGIIEHEVTVLDKIVVALVAPDFDAWKSCLSGDSVKACGSAALDLPWARVLKGAKLIKCNSFVPGTEVLMADGTTKPIEDVRIGDEVLATDPETRTVVRTVIAEITGEGPKDLVTVTITVHDEKMRITATDGHPFWVPALGRWVEAGELTAGQELRTPAGERVRITAADHTRQSATMHNLTIAELHTYYVRAGSVPVLVHNCGGATSPGTPTRARARASATSPTRGSTRPRTLRTPPTTSPPTRCSAFGSAVSRTRTPRRSWPGSRSLTTTRASTSWATTIPGPRVFFATTIDGNVNTVMNGVTEAYFQRLQGG